MTATKFRSVPFFALLAAIAAFNPHSHSIGQEFGSPEYEAAEAAEQAAAELEYRTGLRRARDTLMSVSDFEAALDPAQLVISELQLAQLDASADRAMLAVILAELGRFDDAETELLEVVELVQSTEGLNSEMLVSPLQLLGRTYISARRYPEAVTALTEARSVSRRSAGLFNVEHQIGVIDDLTTAHLGLNDTVTARDLQRERLEVAQRQFGAQDSQVIPYHNSFAKYLESSRLRQSAREQYALALEIAESHGDAGQVLAALSNVVRQDLHSGRRHTMIERLSELVSSPEAQRYTQQLAAAHAVLGDAALMDEEESAAATHYAQAWELFELGGEIDPATYFRDPVAIRFIPPLTAVDIAERSLDFAWGTIVLEFDVAEDGRVAQINGIGSDPEGVMDEAYVERLKSAWFRPTLVAGEPTEAADVVLTHHFRLYFEVEAPED